MNNNGRPRINPYRRAPATREPYDSVLIVCEGAKTEPNYFNALISARGLSSANIKIATPGSSPKTIVSFAQGQLDKYDRVYCVFDGDVDSAEAAARTIASSPEGKVGRWHTAVSTPCFEVWLQLHFKYSTAPILARGRLTAGQAAVKALAAHIPKYQKGHANIFSLVEGRLPEALQNAVKLHKHNVSSSSWNPSTGVHRLVDYLYKIRPS